MKKGFIYITILLAGCLFSWNATGQVQSVLPVEPNLPVNQNPFFDASQKFDISINPGAKGKGLVFPRVDLTTWTFSIQFLTMGDYYPGAYDGMIVYNIATGNTPVDDGSGNNPTTSTSVSPGFYYFSNPGPLDGFSHTTVTSGKWVAISSGNAISSDADLPSQPVDEGQLFYETDTDILWVSNGTTWVVVSPATVTTDASLTGDGKTIPLSLADNAVTSAKIANGTIVAEDLNAMGAGNGQVLKYNGSTWIPAADNNSTVTVEDVLTSTSATNALSANQGRVLNTSIGSKLNSTAAFGGDVSGTYDNLQIAASAVTATELAADAVTSAKIADGTIAATDLSAMGAGNGQVMKYNGTAWVAADDNTISNGSSANNTLYWNGSVWTESSALTNDVTNGIVRVGTITTNHITVGGGDLAVASDAEIDGDLWVDGVLNTPSDIRLKTKIETLTGVLEKIDQLRGVRYEFKDQQKYASGPQVGLIAQELQKVYPELVSQGADGYLAVSYSQLTGVLIQAVKEQQQQMKLTKQEIDLLKKQMQQVMKKLGIN